MPRKPPNQLPRASCSLCSQLADREYATQKFGWEEHDTHLPAVVNQLATVRDLKPGNQRAQLLLQCPECKTYYLYKSDYEYLAGGSEDSQSLKRLGEGDVAGYL